MKRLFTLCFLSAALSTVNAQPTTAPALTLPANNKVNEKSSPYMVWNYVSGATYFEIQIDTTTSFNSPLNYSDTAAANFERPKDLKFGRKYYWRVRGASSSGTGPWSSIYNFTVFSLPVVSVPQASPSTNFMVKGLTSHSANGAWVEYQFDSSNTFTSDYLRIIRTDQPDITNAFYGGLYYGTKYYVRARAYHSNDTTAWTSLRTATTSFYPQISLPANNSLQNSFRIAFTYSKNAWNIPDTGMTYQLQLDTSSLFSNPLMNVFDDSTSYYDTISSHYKFGGKYYFRVRSMHYRDTSDWYPIVFNIYSMPTIYLPGTGTQKPEKLMIVPFNHPGVDYFIYDLDTGYNVGSAYNVSDTILNWKAFPVKYGPYLKFGKRYTLGLRAVRNSDTSEMRTLTFLVLSTITPSYPSNNAWDTPVEMDFSWTANMGDITYQLGIDTVPGMGSPAQKVFNAVNSSHFFVPDLWYGKRIYWGVRGAHPLDTSAWSASRSFTTIAKPTPGWPANGAIDIVKNNDLRSNPIDGSRFYEFQLSEDSLFGTYQSDTVSKDPIWGVSFSLTHFTLNYSTKYFWRVRAINLIDTSDWSDTWKFTTRKPLPVPKKVTLLSPSHNINTIPYYPYIIKFSWSTDSSETYEFQLSKNAAFTSLVEIAYVFGTPQVDIDSLEPNTWYYWRVKAENEENTGPWSDVFAFKTLPVLLYPINLWPDAVTDVPLKQTIDWEDIDGASAYDYRIGTTSNLSSASIRPAFVSEAKPTGLVVNTHYFWEVRARNSYFYSYWSSTADFWTVKVNSTADLKEQMLFCYPQPAENILNVQLPSAGMVSFEILDASGKLLRSKQELYTENILVLELDDLAAGVYAVRLYLNGDAYYFKFVK